MLWGGTAPTEPPLASRAADAARGGTAAAAVYCSTVTVLCPALDLAVSVLLTGAPIAGNGIVIGVESAVTTAADATGGKGGVVAVEGGVPWLGGCG